ncbi:MAG TPA: AAA-like domain-containing protein, partial [Nitrospiraceae bacterium]|nr:AAA-like domain-containing protein [Nitrospiraceae bacterium]
PTRTPFNIGRRIDLTDFTATEAKPLARGLSSDESQSEKALDRILFWTGGHPYLTQKLCDLMVKHADDTASTEAVDRLVEEHFFAPEASRAEYNLAFVRDRLTKDKRSADLLNLYRRIYNGKAVLDDPISPIHSALKLSGLVVPRGDRVLRVRNRIYERVFTGRWAKQTMPANWNQRVAIGLVAVLVLAFLFWYEVLQPRPYIETLQTVSEDYQVAYQAYQNLHSIVGYGGTADRLLAEFWDRRSVRAQAEGDRDRGLLTTIQALNANETETRRRQSTLLVGSDYADLLSTYRHGNFVTSVAFSPNGKLLLTGSGDRTARLWRTDTGAPVGPPLRHENSVTAVAFSPDGKLVLTGSWDGTARLWRTDTGAPVGQPLRHEKYVRAVAFSLDGKTVLTATQWWVHFSAISDETLMPKESRLLPGSWTGGYRFLNESGSSLQIALRSTPETVSIESLLLDRPQAEPLAGDPKVLLEEWKNKLALKFADGKFVPLWPVSESGASGSRGGSF